ncbi:ABC transporter substrate-binding protein [Pseudoroseomonas cervicalis]|uniref:ABC transporter substrate-binding protein n=1 Tax=Teichococcus cervicalis TaxID=204525 RepID=UPI002789D514|nr:ABC transporter substrate-binding protein [Pseudoroseomonas cervicalis]MDQ1078808.1 putative thiamine transport system substrate-binding protein [Pseudoroseomonas cervicalis]
MDRSRTAPPGEDAPQRAGAGRRALLRGLAGSAALAAMPARAQPLPTGPWERVVARARNQVVHFHALGGDAAMDAYIAWGAARLRRSHGITLRHIRLRALAEGVARLAAERAAGRDRGGAIDLLWCEGQPFLALKQQGLLRRFAYELPNFALVDTVGKPATALHHSVAVEGYGAPWRMTQLVFLYDSARLPRPPLSMLAMPDWAREHPGRLTHPQPRDPLGAGFLTQALYEMVAHPRVLAAPATDDNAALVTAPFWEWYGALRPHLWRQGRAFPPDAAAQRQLLREGETDIAIAAGPADGSAAIAHGLLPETVRSYVPTIGSIGSASFLAIPANAAQPEAAMLAANFFLSPEAQAHAQDPAVLGSPTVLDLDRLSEADQQRFAALPRGVATLSNAALGRPLPEPHPSWAARLTEEWERRIALPMR